MLFSIGGIYNDQSIIALNSIKVNKFVFDLRPLSMNFIQLKNIADMIQNTQNKSNKYYLQFEDEKDFVIQQSLQTLSRHFEKDFSEFNNINLYFSGIQDFTFYNQFNTPYSWRFTELVEIPTKEELTQVTSVLIDYTYLESLMNFGDLFGFVKELKSKFNEGTTFGLITKFQSNLLESIIDFIDFDICHIDIDNSVESGFRQINTEVLKERILYINSAFSAQNT